MFFSSLSLAEGYAAFQEDSSADEAESPSKMKRSKGIHVFKKPSFSKKKEKDFKVKEKGPKEEKAKDKKSKDLTAADVVKQWKEKKKKKPSAEPEPVVTETATMFRPIFGAPLAEAVRRTALYDGIQLPAIFRECVDYIESYGMKCEGIYRVSGTAWFYFLWTEISCLFISGNILGCFQLLHTIILTCTKTLTSY